jgi:hypothetical protein
MKPGKRACRKKTVVKCVHKYFTKTGVNVQKRLSGGKGVQRTKLDPSFRLA